MVLGKWLVKGQVEWFPLLEWCPLLSLAVNIKYFNNFWELGRVQVEQCVLLSLAGLFEWFWGSG